MKVNSGISRQLKLLRKRKKITQAELAEIIGIGQTAIANYENGKRFPDEKNLIKLADYFETSLDHLIGRNYRITENKITEQPGFNYTPSLLKDLTDEYMEKSLKSSTSGVEFITQLLTDGFSEEQIMLDLFQESLIKTGNLWSEGKYSEAMEHQISMSIVHSMLMMRAYNDVSTPFRGKAVALTAAGELHNIGLRMICRFLEIDGWETFFLGSSVPVNSLQEFISSNDIDLVVISMTLNENSDSVCSMAKTLKTGKTPPRIIVGGSGTLHNSKQLSEAGVDYYGINSVEAVAFTKGISTKSKSV